MQGATTPGSEAQTQDDPMVPCAGSWWTFVLYEKICVEETRCCCLVREMNVQGKDCCCDQVEVARQLAKQTNVMELVMR